MSQAEIGAFVQSHLASEGVEVVLSGGASVSIYSKGKYVSKDLDMVNVHLERRAVIVQAMRQLGFVEKGRYFIHPDSDHLVEFPPGPLAVGSEPVKSIQEVRLSTGRLRVVSPTDCVKDRLAHYFHWHDHQGLAQAILVAKNHRINIREIGRWARAEGMGEEFNKIRSQLQPRRRR